MVLLVLMFDTSNTLLLPIMCNIYYIYLYILYIIYISYIILHKFRSKYGVESLLKSLFSQLLLFVAVFKGINSHNMFEKQIWQKVF